MRWLESRAAEFWFWFSELMSVESRAIAQEVSRRIPTAVAPVPARVWLCGICGGQSGTWAGFLRVLRFPCQFSFHRLLHTHHLSSRAGTIGQLVTDVPSGLSLTPSQETKKKKNNIELCNLKRWVVSFKYHRFIPVYTAPSTPKREARVGPKARLTGKMLNLWACRLAPTWIWYGDVSMPNFL
jgi:hypothetical protein